MSMLLWSKRTGLLVGLMGAYYIHSLVWITVVVGVHNQLSSYMALPELSLHSRGGHHIQHPKPFGPLHNCICLPDPGNDTANY